MILQRNERFRDYLYSELLKRTKKNARFSLRAFAKQLEIQPAALSQILRGERTLTDKMCQRLAGRMNLPPDQTRSLMQLEVDDRSTTQSYRHLDTDLFNAIADWQHYALLELTHLSHFKPNEKWIASVLGLSVHEVRAARERLERLEFLEIDPKGNWIDRMGDAVNRGNEVTAAAFRRYQKQVLEKALDALESVPYDLRVQSSMVIPASLSRLPKAKKRIARFIQDLGEELRSGSTRDEVYHLGISLYPVSKVKQTQGAES